MIRFKEFLVAERQPRFIEIFIPVANSDGAEFQMLQEGKIVSGRYKGNIRIDQPKHGVGQTHAHVYGRRGNEIGVINLDGSSSHGSKMKLHKKDILALKGHGFDVPADGIVEWIKADGNFLLVEGTAPVENHLDYSVTVGAL